MKKLLLASTAALSLSSAAFAQVLMLDFGATATDRNTNSPYHAANGAFSDGTWNTLGLSDPGSVLYSDGSVATDVVVDLGLNSGTTGKTINLGSQPTTLLAGSAYTTGSNIYTGTSVGRDGVFGGSASTTTPWVGVQVRGLAAGTYDIYVAARNTNTGNSQPNYNQFVYVGGSTAGDFDFSAYSTKTLNYDGSNPLNASSAWVEADGAGENYVKLSVSITTGQAINIAVTGTEGAGSGLNRGFLNAIQIVNTTAIPEPSAFAALAGLGVLGLAATRRRRA